MANSGRLSPIQWTICIIAAIGFGFDTYELLMLPLVLPPALLEMLHVAPGTPEFSHWRGLMFFIPALVGGVFGLIATAMVVVIVAIAAFGPNVRGKPLDA